MIPLISIPMILFIILFSSDLKGKNVEQFPLWGSSWLVADGNNKRIYPSVLPLIPEKIIRIDFMPLSDPYKRAIVYWENYSHKDYWGTAEITNGFGKRLGKQKKEIVRINKDEGIDIAYQPFDDTLWSINEAIIEEFNNEYDYAQKIQGKEEKIYRKGSAWGLTQLRAEIQDKSAYTKSKPAAWVRRHITAADKQEFTLGKWSEPDEKYFYYRQSTQEESSANVKTRNGTAIIKSVGAMEFDIDGIKEYCDDNYYYKKLPDKKLTFKTENLGYWQVHVYPEIWYYPRDYTTGQAVIYDTLKKSHTEALALKKQSIENPNSTELKYWRNPYFSDSASTVISFAFTEDGTVLKDQRFIWLSGSAIGSKISYEHYPKKMYSISSRQSLRAALLQLYSASDDDEQYAQTLDLRCGESTWEAIDEANGRIIFPLNKRNKGVYERDWNVNDGYFRYNGCPCARSDELGNRTKAEIRRFIVYPVPTCNLDDIMAAMSFYRLLSRHLDAPKDVQIISRNITEANRVWSDKVVNYSDILGGEQDYKKISEFYYNIAKERERICPDTWVSAIKALVGY